jgi:hypothetical protein
MPLLRIKSSGALTPRIQKIADCGYIQTSRKSNQKLYIKLMDKIDELFIQTNGAVHADEQSCSRRRTNNNTIDNNTNIIKGEAKASLTPREEMLNFIKDFRGNVNQPAEVAKFISYWTEPTKDGRKQRWETEKTFEVHRRMGTWLERARAYEEKNKPYQTKNDDADKRYWKQFQADSDAFDKKYGYGKFSKKDN